MGPRGTWEGPGSGNSDEEGERAMMPGIEGGDAAGEGIRGGIEGHGCIVWEKGFGVPTTPLLGVERG